MLKTAIIFGNHMTLQRQKPIEVWGTTSEKEVTLKLSDSDEIFQASVDSDGNWKATLSPREANTGLELYINAGKEELHFTDVRVGEVWLAGGQSNMEYFLKYDEEQEQVLKSSNDNISFFDYPEVQYEEQYEELDFSRFGIWRECNSENLPYYSAVAYYFANKIQNELNVPVGIVACNFGGTPACAWMDYESLRGTEAECWLTEYEEGLKKIDMNTYKQAFCYNPANDHSNPFEETQQKQFTAKMFYPGLTWEEQQGLLVMMQKFAQNGPGAMMNVVGPYSEQRPGGLYETMLLKVVPYTIRGILFYQGESDEVHADKYNFVLTKLINDWRALWMDKLPFVMAQIAPFGMWLESDGKRFPMVRKAQQEVEEQMEDVFMCSTSDCGMYYDIHPKAKRPVGERMALSALGNIYGKDLNCNPPKASVVHRSENEISIEFKNSKGLFMDGEIKTTPRVLDNEGKELTVKDIHIQDEKLIIEGKFATAKCVEFGNCDYYEINIYNKDLNPVLPFDLQICN